MKRANTLRKIRAASKRRSRALRIYGWLLRLYPEAHRRAFREPMQQTFLDCYRETVERGGGSETRFWVGVISDESRSLVREHLATLGERGRIMKSVLPVVGKLTGGILALLLWVVVLYLLSPILSVPPYAWLPATVIYAGALVVVYYLVRSLPRREGDSIKGSWRSSWWRLGLVLGALAGLYMLVLNVVFVLTQFGPGQVLAGMLVVWSNADQAQAAFYVALTVGPL
jgi:hypothetical protein